MNIQYNKEWVFSSTDERAKCKFLLKWTALAGKTKTDYMFDLLKLFFLCNRKIKIKLMELLYPGTVSEIISQSYATKSILFLKLNLWWKFVILIDRRNRQWIRNPEFKIKILQKFTIYSHILEYYCHLKIRKQISYNGTSGWDMLIKKTHKFYLFEFPMIRYLKYNFQTRVRVFTRNATDFIPWNKMIFTYDIKIIFKIRNFTAFLIFVTC